MPTDAFWGLAGMGIFMLACGVGFGLMIWLMGKTDRK
jgi:predicted cobalt transporter CbtA